mgnify:CR=1 FL=1
MKDKFFLQQEQLRDKLRLKFRLKKLLNADYWKSMVSFIR